MEISDTGKEEMEIKEIKQSHGQNIDVLDSFLEIFAPFPLQKEKE